MKHGLWQFGTPSSIPSPVPPPPLQDGAAAKISTDGYLNVDIDIPMPFALMPKQILEVAGNTSMHLVLNTLLVRLVCRAGDAQLPSFIFYHRSHPLSP